MHRSALVCRSIGARRERPTLPRPRACPDPDGVAHADLDELAAGARPTPPVLTEDPPLNPTASGRPSPRSPEEEGTLAYVGALTGALHSRGANHPRTWKAKDARVLLDNAVTLAGLHEAAVVHYTALIQKR
jgi:hypothetical protein